MSSPGDTLPPPLRAAPAAPLDRLAPPAWMRWPGAWGGNLQTLWSARLSRRFTGAPPPLRWETWTTPDQDFVEVAFGDAPAPPDAPMLVLFHGLEGDWRSHYSQAFAHWAREQGLRFALPHFRGCGTRLNLAPRGYHSGDHEEIGWILDRLRARAGAPLLVAGVSLGGNALLRWAQEAGDSASRTAAAIAALSAPVDLAAAGHAIGRPGFNRFVYTQRYFLPSLKRKALRKWDQHPGLFDRERLRAARDLYEFDSVFTAPVHGFRDTEDYWARAAAKPHLARVRLPALVLNALNDPFLPARHLPRPDEVGRFVTLWQPAHGGHVGFATGPGRGTVTTLPDVVGAWLRAHLR